MKRNSKIPKQNPWNKILWTSKMDEFLAKNFRKMNNRQLAKSLGLKLSTTRARLYQLGYKRMELEYWTDEQIQTLLNQYEYWGDVELAEFFNSKYPKRKGWTKKHIEKKRRLLGLKRTKEQIKEIQKRNIQLGRFRICPIKRWIATGVMEEGKIRLWRNGSSSVIPMIKINGKFVQWSRWMWENKHGKIPEGMNVVYVRCNPSNFFKENITIDNLEIVDNAELARRNSMISSHGLSDNYVIHTLTNKDSQIYDEIKKYPLLIKLKRQQLLLRRQINAAKK